MSAALRIAGKRRRVRIGIINDTDAPEARMLALAIGMPGAAEVEYLSPHHRPLRGKGYKLHHWTDAALFGVELSLTADGGLRVEQVFDSTAAYPDGVPRRWQGRRMEEIALRPALAATVARVVSSGRVGEVAA